MTAWRRVARPRLVLGTTSGRLLPSRYILDSANLYRHVHLIGTTGVGKSKAIASRAAQLMQQGAGIAVIDPHGDLALDLLGLLADTGFFADPRAYRRLLYLDFGRTDRFLPWNLLHSTRHSAHALANHLTEVCKRVWPALADGSAPQFENTLKPAVVALVDNQLPLTALSRLLTDKPYRDRLLAQVTDPLVRAFFSQRYDRWGKDAPTIIESTLRRAFLLSFSPTLRYCLGQVDNRLDFRALMDDGVSVVANLAGLDEDTQRLIASLLAVSFEEAAMSREDIPEISRRPYFLHIDEYSLCSATSEESLTRVLALARKYNLYLLLAHQTFSQLSTRMLGALQNCITIAFRLGPLDAELMAPRFAAVDPLRVKHQVADAGQIDRTHPVFYTPQEQLIATAQVLTGLRERECLVKLGRDVLRVKTLTVPPVRTSQEELTAIRERYAELLMVPRSEVVPAVDGLLESSLVSAATGKPLGRREHLPHDDDDDT